MNSESPIKHVRWAIMCSVIGFALTGCADTPYRPAPITSVNDSSSNRTVSTSPVTTNSNAGVATPIERGSTPLQTTPPPSIRVNNTTAQPQSQLVRKMLPHRMSIRMVADALCITAIMTIFLKGITAVILIRLNVVIRCFILRGSRIVM